MVKHLLLRRYLPLAAILAAALWRTAPALERDLWFDEALTLLNFAFLGSPGEIYRNYVIPNNQIVHTVLLHYWKDFTPGGLDFSLWLRLLPLATALATLAAFYCRFRVRMGRLVLLVVLAAWAVSPPFAIYGSALRGYMLSALWITLAADAALNYAGNGSKKWAAWFFVLSLLAIGTIPTNLVGLAGAVLYALPLCGRDCCRNRRLYVLAALPLAAFAVFYLPIFRPFLGVLRLGEGWSDGFAALKATYAAFAVGFAMLILPVVLGANLLCFRPGYNWTFSARAAILLLPIPVCLVLSIAPFPRTFFPLWPLWILLLAGAIRRLVAYQERCRKRWSGKTFLYALTGAVLVWGAVENGEAFKIAFSRRFGGAGGDDFFAPYYMRGDFRPRELFTQYRKLELPAPPAVYLSFSSDPWSLMFQGQLAGLGGDIWRFDGPRGRVRELPAQSLVILNSADPVEPVEQRFNLKLRKCLELGRHSIYRTSL
ncbi:MAG: hypothetical protein AB7F32_08160 [Victivallaceae bacterium]